MTNEQADAAVKNLMEAFKKLEGPQKVALQKRLGATAVAEAEKGVRSGRDPYGTNWTPLTSRTGQPLRRTGTNIQRSWHSRETGPITFEFGSRFKWLRTHQYGAVIRARYAKALKFWVEGATSIYSRHGAGSKRLVGKGGGASQMNLVIAQKVTIPRRQMIPEEATGGLGRIWTGAFRRTTRRYLIELFKSTHADVGGQG